MIHDMGGHPIGSSSSSSSSSDSISPSSSSSLSNVPVAAGANDTNEDLRSDLESFVGASLGVLGFGFRV
jgi:hypothetical protein